MINNVFAKREMEKRKFSVNEYNDSWTFIHCDQFSGKCKPVKMIDNLYQRVIFAIE